MRDYCLRAAATVGLAAISLSASAASASLPALLWQGATSVRVQCLVTPGQDAAAAPLQQQLCDRVVTLAKAGAPLPVSTIEFGDPQVIAAGTVALLVHGSIQHEGDKRLLAFSIRPYRNSAEQSTVLFGAAPRAASLTAAGTPTPALDTAIAAALRDTLPWQNRPQAPTPLTRQP